MALAGLEIGRSDEVRAIRAIVRSQDRFLRDKFRFPEGIPRFTMKNVEHALCEYSRYVDRWNRL
jgi:hypothetical protein